MPLDRQTEDELIESSAKPLTRDQLLYALAISQKQLDRIEKYVDDDSQWLSTDRRIGPELLSRKRRDIKHILNFGF
tara:strand:- start:1749 stop:1976 length:228 start_codon:yes stop_codon:yes gene_type:complete